MRIIHTGDIHLGSVMQTLPAQKAKLRQMELLDHFRALAEYAKANKVEAVLIAGDLFDFSGVHKQIKTELFFIIEKAKPVCFYYVQGNHDEHVDLEGKPENLYLFSSHHGWFTYRLSENVTLTGADTRNFNRALFSGVSLEQNAFNILLLHGDIYKADEKEGINISSLKGKYVDYLALGHIHKPMYKTEKLDNRGEYRYCGCLEARGFDECGEHGFFLLEIERGKIRSEEFLSFAKRNVLQIQADISRAKNYYDVERIALSSLEQAKGEDIIKLVLIGTHTAELKKDIALLSDRLNERYFFVRVEDESRIFIDRESLKKDVSEKGEFVREVYRYEMNEELRQEILEVGLKALSGEEIDL